MSVTKIAGLAQQLLAWYDQNAPALPWRRTRDPYRIWVSEVMLQQTRIESVIPYYDRFLAEFPTLRHLAEAPEERVLALWEGLGYYHRARQLQAAARLVISEFNGQLPSDRDQLRRLPGVGSYTAGALLSIVFGQPEPAIDGNVIRVLARLLAIEESVNRPTVRIRIEWQIRTQVPEDRPGDFNQALMDLGRTVCTPVNPRCGACPLAEICQARARGLAEALPRRSQRPRPKLRTVVSLAVISPSDGRVLMEQRRPDGLLAGMWQFPQVEVPDDLADDPEALRGAACQLVERLIDADCDPQPVGRLEHVFTHLRWRIHLFRLDAPAGAPVIHGETEMRWVSEAGAARLPAATVQRRLMDLLRRVRVAR